MRSAIQKKIHPENREKCRVTSAGVFAKHILKRLGNEIRRNEEEKI